MQKYESSVTDTVNQQLFKNPEFKPTSGEPAEQVT